MQLRAKSRLDVQATHIEKERPLIGLLVIRHEFNINRLGHRKQPLRQIANQRQDTFQPVLPGELGNLKINLSTGGNGGCYQRPLSANSNNGPFPFSPSCGQVPAPVANFVEDGTTGPLYAGGAMNVA